MSFTMEKVDGTVRLIVDGQGSNRLDLTRAVLDQLAQGERKFVVDLANISYVDSAWLGAVAAATTTVRKQGGDLRLVNVNDDLQQLFELTRLIQLWPKSDEGEGGAGKASPLVPSSGPLRGAAAMPIPENEQS